MGGKGSYLSIEICHVPLQTILKRHDDFDVVLVEIAFGDVLMELLKENRKLDSFWVVEYVWDDADAKLGGNVRVQT